MKVALVVIGAAVALTAGIAAFTGHLTTILDNLSGLSRRLRRGTAFSCLVDKTDLGRWVFNGQLEGPQAQMERQIRFFVTPTPEGRRFRVTNALLLGHRTGSETPFLTIPLELIDVDTNERPKWPSEGPIHLRANLPPVPESHLILDLVLDLHLEDQHGRVLEVRIPNGHPFGQRPNVPHVGLDKQFWVPTSRGEPRKLGPDEPPPFRLTPVDELVEQFKAEDAMERERYRAAFEKGPEPTSDIGDTDS